MSYILNIDTATETAGVCLSKDNKVLAVLSSIDQKSHASFIQPAIASLTEQTGVDLRDLSAVAVTGGPGSYTGLRVGMATAKGICMFSCCYFCNGSFQETVPCIHTQIIFWQCL